jgi:hypothetical protein
MYTVKFDQSPAGHALNSGRSGEEITICQKEFVSSEDGDLLISRLEGFPAEILSMLPGGGPVPATVVHLLVIIRPDKSADVYMNDDLQIISQVQAKRGFRAGEPVMTDDIADVLRISFPGVELPPDAGIVFLFSAGWRKGLYYDFKPLGAHSDDVDQSFRSDADQFGAKRRRALSV